MTDGGERERRRPVWWVSVLTGVVVVALVLSLVVNGSLPLPGQSDPTTTLIRRPTLPGEGAATTAPTFAGVSARCRDGTYAYVGGSTDESQLCAANGGVEQRFGG